MKPRGKKKRYKSVTEMVNDLSGPKFKKLWKDRHRALEAEIDRLTRERDRLLQTIKESDEEHEQDEAKIAALDIERERGNELQEEIVKRNRRIHALEEGLREARPHVAFLVARNPNFEEPQKALEVIDALLQQAPGNDRCKHDVDGTDCYECYPTLHEPKKKASQPVEAKSNENRCSGIGCTYSRSMDQAYPRKCVVCGNPEPSAPAEKRSAEDIARELAHALTPRCTGGRLNGGDSERWHSKVCDLGTDKISAVIRAERGERP